MKHRSVSDHDSYSFTLNEYTIGYAKRRLAIGVFNFLVHCVNAKRPNDVTRHETVVILK